MNNKRAIYKFLNLEFLTLFSNIVIWAYFDPKLTFLSLKILLNYIYIQNTGWNNPITQVGPEKSKIKIFAISGRSKIHRIRKHSNTCHVLNFFFKCSQQYPLSESITIEITKNCKLSYSPLKVTIHFFL